MVDALVTNAQPDEALTLVQEIAEDAAKRDILNTVVYSTLLKGFAQSRQPGKVQKVFEEMQETGIACNTVSYNTMIDANARTGRMDRCDELFQQMQVSLLLAFLISFNPSCTKSL